MSAPRLLAAALLVSLVLVAGACGEKDESGGPPAATTGTPATAPERTKTSPASTGAREDDTRADGERGGRAVPEEDAAGDGAAARTPAAAFVRRAEDACRDAAAELREVQAELSDLTGQPSREELRERLERAIDRQIAVYARTTDRIARLDPPGGRAADVAELIRVRRKVNQIQRAYRTALKAQRREQVAKMALKQARAERKAARLATELDVKTCG